MIEALFIIVPIFILVVFIFTFALILSPKLKGKMMSKQIKATKYMIDESKEEIEAITEEIKDGVKTIKDGLTKDWICPHCGEANDNDAKFCKKCGNELNK